MAQLYPTLCDPSRFLCPCNSLNKNTGVGYHALLQGIFPTQVSNPGLLHCMWTLYHLSHRGSPKEPVASPPLQGTSVSQVTGRILTMIVTRMASLIWISSLIIHNDLTLSLSSFFGIYLSLSCLCHHLFLSFLTVFCIITCAFPSFRLLETQCYTGITCI